MIEMNAAPYLYALKGKKRSAAKITIQKYYLPSGKSTQNIGVTADIKMNSVNEFLPIGESDLPHALESDEIPAVVARRGTKDFVIGAGAIAHLEKLSRKRQDSLNEFDHLQTNIDWYKGKREQKDFSLNLENRLKQKREDDTFSERMKESMEKLATGAYTSTKVKLDVVEDLERRSKAVREEEEEEEEEEIKEPAPMEIDIRLRESLRVMSDWIRHRAEMAEAVAETPQSAKES
jgi:carboxyl-terminal processing protease